MLQNRKVIFKCVSGSHLYGTDLPTSDDDYTGIFLPSTADLLGLNTAPKEITDNIKTTDSVRNVKGDVDCKYLSLHHFLRLAMEGQSIATELFFVPEHQVIMKTKEWDLLQENRHLLFSKKGISPFIGFAMAQSNKSEIKGSNLKKIQDLIDALTPELGTPSAKNKLLSEMFEDETNDHIFIKGIPVKKRLSDNKTDIFDIAGRGFNYNIRLKMFLRSLTRMESRYGTRSANAAKEGIDYKSLCHAYRLVSEAEEFLLHQNITFPRPDASFLKSIRRGQYEANYRDEINEKIDFIKREVEPKSTLPNKPNFNKVNELCMGIVGEHLNE